jgi:type IV secretory pathway TraG/TraD family ATPase VirD4
MSFVKKEAVQRMLDQAIKRVAKMSESRQKDYLMIENYFKNEWLTLPEKTLETVKSLATNAVDPFTRGAIRELFSTTSTITPEALGEGKIIVVDIPAITFASGKASAVVWKYMVQKWAERRPKNGDETRPVFIFADECQYFATPRDAVFQSTARSARVATVYLTQTIGSLNFFGNKAFRTYRDQLLGNLINKVFHQNTDTETNEWAANFIGKDLILRTSRNTGGSQGEGTKGTISSSRTVFEQYDFLFPPIGFQNLKIGGAANNLIVSAVLIAGARRQFYGQKFAILLFKQGLLERAERKN